MPNNILEMKNICKAFPGVKALDNVDFTAEGGKVNCIVGENGAGKSTLIKALAGVHTKDSGKIFLNGKLLNITSLTDAKKRKINFIFQDTNLCDKLTVFENYTLGKEKNTFGIVDKKSDYLKTVRDFKEMGIDIDLNSLAKNLSVAEKQILEILRAFDEESKVIVYDEPSSSLTESETLKLFNVINILKKKNVIIIYISHRLDEIFRIGDYVTVLRNGKNIGKRMKVTEIDKNKLIELIIGEKQVKKTKKELSFKKEDIILEAKNLSTNDLSNLNFHLNKGEILGVTGLLGSGYDKVGKALFGLEKIKRGEIIFYKEKMDLKDPRMLIRDGFCYIPEKRREEALFGILSVLNNISISSTGEYSKFGVINSRKERRLAHNFIEKLDIKTPSIYKKVRDLSGGNQQKVVIARGISTRAKLMLLIEPTHGIDVKAKSEIYSILKDLSAVGVSVLICSTEYSELVELCNRILIMKSGGINKILSGDEIKEKLIMQSLL